MSLRSRLSVVAFATSALAALSASSALADPNLVVNGGFEDGSFFPLSDWGGTGAYKDDNANLPYTNPPHSGSSSAAFLNVGFLNDIYQTLPTTPGEKYDLTYWLYSNGATPNQFVVSVGGATLFNETDIPFQDWTKYNYQFTATTNATVLDFAGRDDPSVLGLDDVSVTAVPAVPAVPEPGATAFGVIAVGSILGMVARKRKAK